MQTQRNGRLAVPGVRTGGLSIGMRRNVLGLPGVPLAVWILLFVGVPGGFLIAFSFQTYTFFDVGLPWTLKNYINLAGAASYLKLLVKTFIIAFVVTVGAISLASPFAYYVARVVGKRLAVILLLLTVLPLWMNQIVRNYAWLALTSNKGVLNSIIGFFGFPAVRVLFTTELVIVVGISLALPFAILVLYARMSNISHEVEEASLDLGSNRFHTFRKVVFPLSASGYQTATLLIFMPTLAFYVTPLMLGGREGSMIGNALMPIVKDSLNFAMGSAFMAPVILTLVVMVLIFRRGINIDNLYSAGVGSGTARRAPRKSPALAAYTGVVLLITYLPLFAMVFFSFGNNQYAMFPTMGATLKWYAYILETGGLLQSLKMSIIIAIEVAVIALVLCAPAAYAVVRFRFLGRGAFLFMTLLPMLIPELILGMALLTMIVTFDVQLSIHTIAIGHVTLALPFVFLTILAQQYGFDRAIEEASRDLGSSATGTFFKIVFPLMVPALIAAGFLAITISFNDFVVAFLLTGGEATFPIYIFGLTKSSVTPTTNALGTLLMIIVVAALVLMLTRPWTPAFRRLERARLRLVR